MIVLAAEKNKNKDLKSFCTTSFRSVNFGN